MYQARLWVVLSECDDQMMANAELERAMQELRFQRSAQNFEDRTNLASNILLGV